MSDSTTSTSVPDNITPATSASSAASQPEIVDPAERRRAHIILFCFLAFFLFCIPTHIITSRVYRGDLPSHDTIMELQSHVQHMISHPHTTITCHIVSPQHEIDSELLKIWHDIVKQKLTPISREWTITGKILSHLDIPSTPSQIDDLLQSQPHDHTHYTFYLLPCSRIHWYMGRYTHGWTCMGETPHRWDDMATSLMELINNVLLPTEAFPDSQDLLRLPTHISYHSLSLTLLNAMSSTTEPLSWNIEQGMNTWLLPFLQKTERIITWHTDTQVLYYAELAPHAKPIEGGSGYYVTSHQLRNFVGTTRWNVVSPLVSSSIELLVYVPQNETRPLYIKHSTKKEMAPSNTDTSPSGYSSSFIVPRWGGVVIYNPSDNNIHELTVDQLKPIFESFIAQLRVMCGLTPYHQSSSSYTLLPSPSDGITDWELDALSRARVLQNAVKIEDTLRSLYALLERVRHMPVDDHIAANVTYAVHQLKESLSLYRSGAWPSSIAASRASLTSAESGFFDHSMIPLLYFPDEHLYAVYAPLFLPIVIPVVGATIKLFKQWKKSRGKLHAHIE